MWGGPAHQDTWDPKPDAPADYRGEFKPIPTSVSGVRICEHLPRLAGRLDQLALIRSMTHPDVNHTTATHYLLTGRGVPRPDSPRGEDWPTYGAVLSSLGRGKGPLPPFVSMMPVVPNGAPRFVEESHGQDAGWLGPLHNPTRIDADASKPDYRVAEFSLRADLPQPRTDARRQLLRDLDRQRLGMERQLEVAALGAHYERAFGLLAARGATAAFDLTQEPLPVRERYGMNIHGQSVLQARRLVEAGVPLVTVFWPNDGLTNVSVYWDTHNRNFVDLKTRLCPVTDQAFSALLDDLAARGLLNETLVVWTGEMGRTPRVGQSVVGGAGAGRDGRDHWPHVFTSVLAGAVSRAAWFTAPATAMPRIRPRTRRPRQTWRPPSTIAWASTRRKSSVTGRASPGRYVRARRYGRFYIDRHLRVWRCSVASGYQSKPRSASCARMSRRSQYITPWVVPTARPSPFGCQHRLEMKKSSSANKVATSVRDSASRILMRRAP
jgi:hypothetical protein